MRRAWSTVNVVKGAGKTCLNVSSLAENSGSPLTNGESRETLDGRYENLRILNARERAGDIRSF